MNLKITLKNLSGFVLLLILDIFIIFRIPYINSIYSKIWMWPVAYTIIYLVIFSNTKVKSYHKIAIYFLIYIQLVQKFLLYPLCLSLTSNSYEGVYFFADDKLMVDKAIYLGILEIVVLGIFIYVLENLKEPDNLKKDQNYFSIIGNKTIYYLFIGFAFILYMIYGKRYNLISFLSIEEKNYETGGIITLLKYIIIIAIYITVLMIFNWGKEKYDKTNKVFYIAFVTIAALSLVCIIQGESRSGQMYIALLMILMLINMFPKYKMVLTTSVTFAGIAVVIIISLFREGSINWFESYEHFASKLQTYVGGPMSLATNMTAFEEGYHLGFSDYIYDFFRSCFPISLFLEDKGMMISQKYNMFIYSGLYDHGHIVFSTTYLYPLLGVIGAPLTICFNTAISCYFNKKFSFAKGYETKFLFGYCMFRSIFGILTNAPTYLGGITQYLAIFGFIILASKIFNKIKSKR